MEDADRLIELSTETFKLYTEFIHQLTGITIGANRINMVQGRFRKRIGELKLKNFESYLDFTRKTATEKPVFIDLITTNETQFFRTPRIWKYISEVYLPHWYQANPKKVFTAWSAAASSGEEAHTLGVVCQHFKEKHPDFLFQILGTDISNEMVQLCQEGRYGDKSLQGFKALKSDCFSKFMRKQIDETYQTIPEIKSRLRFHQHNLFTPLRSKDSFDLILLRNVLIYFTPTDQEKVLELARQNLGDSGILIIGESESLTHIKTSFHYLEPLIYNKNLKGEAA